MRLLEIWIIGMKTYVLNVKTVLCLCLFFKALYLLENYSKIFTD